MDNLYKRLVEQIERHLDNFTECVTTPAKHIHVQRARGIWEFGQYLIQCHELALDQTQSDNYWDLYKVICDADHGLDGK